MATRRGQTNLLLSATAVVAVALVGFALAQSYRWLNRPFPGFFVYANLHVAPDHLPGWSGQQAGLRFLDRVVAFEGRPVRSAEAIYRAVSAAPAGRPFRYVVARGDERFAVTVSSMRFSARDWMLSYGIYLLVAVGFLAIGFAPLYIGSSSPSSLPLFFMMASVFVWLATTFDFVTESSLPKEMRIFAFALTPGIGLHLGLSLTDPSGRMKARRWFLALAYGTAAALAIFSAASFFSGEAWPRALRLGYLYLWAAAVVFFVMVARALARPVAELERARLRVIALGAVLGFLLPSLGAVLVSSFRWELPYNFLLVAAVFFPLSVAYALLRYDLAEIESVVRLGVTRAALAGVLLLCYVLVLAALNLSIGIYETSALVPLLFSVLVALVFNPLLSGVDAAVNRYLYRRDYDPEQLEAEVSGALRHLARPQALATRWAELVARHLGLDSALILLRAAGGGHEVAGRWPPGRKAPEIRPGWSESLARQAQPLSREQLLAAPTAGVGERRLEILRGLEAELLLPLVFEQEPLGVAALGRKRSGRGYSGEELRLLGRLADQLALAIKNGMLYEDSERAQERYRRLYAESEALNRRLVEMDRLKKEFVANVTHELRTPVSTILGYAEVLRNLGVTKDSGWIVERLVHNGQELSQLMDSLLDFSRMEAGTMNVALQEIDLRELLKTLETVALRLIRDRPIAFHLAVEPDVGPFTTDPKKLQRILLHLVTNAVKFTERGSITVRAQRSRGAGRASLEIAVEDTGIGIERENQEVIFEDFRQLDGSPSRRYGGTGIGLSLCRGLARALGGRIELESAPGLGSRFRLVLPFAPVAAAASSA